jgi:hypothetical protein
MAASRDNSRIVEDVDVQYLPIATSSTSRIGDLLIFNGSSNCVEPMTAVAQSTAFVGVAGSVYPGSTTDGNVGDFVKVYKRGVFEFDLTTTTTQYYHDDEFRWAGAAANKVELSTSNPIGRVWKKNVVGDTVVRLRIDKYVVF